MMRKSLMISISQSVNLGIRNSRKLAMVAMKKDLKEIEAQVQGLKEVPRADEFYSTKLPKDATLAVTSSTIPANHRSIAGRLVIGDIESRFQNMKKGEIQQETTLDYPDDVVARQHLSI
jgi:hypothetical protein